MKFYLIASIFLVFAAEGVAQPRFAESALLRLAQYSDDYRSQEFDDGGGGYDPDLDGDGSRGYDRDSYDPELDGEPTDDPGEGVTYIESEEFDRNEFEPKRKRPRRKKKRPPRRFDRGGGGGGGSIASVLRLLKNGESARASAELFELGKDPSYRSERPRIRYLLGLALMEMGLDQVAAFQFVSVIKAGGSRLVANSLEKLSIVGSQLGDNTLIDYAISRISERRFPRDQKDLFYFRKGEFLIRNQEYIKAAKRFARVRRGSPFFLKARYKEGLAWAYAKKKNRALRAFNSLIRERSQEAKNDKVRVAAELAKARVYYQFRDWKNATKLYRRIPRDSELWHDTLFEQSWTFLMSAQFRSALSNFHSLHSPYYENFYMPESLILRAIVYLYICKYDEMQKVSSLFDRIYGPLLGRVKSYLRSHRRSSDNFREFNDYLDYWRAGESSGFKEDFRGNLPTVIGKYLLRDGELRQLFSYLNNIRREEQIISSRSAAWQNSGIGDYAYRAVKKRIAKTKKKIGLRIRKLITEIYSQLQEFVEQNGLLRFEMINAKKEVLKKKISGRSLQSKKTIDEDDERDFYIRNGYEYWPFKGEYWLDEVGNFHYLGVHGCE